MLKNALLLILALVCSAQLSAQNMVTNPGFEEMYKCPTARGEIIVLPIYRDFPTVLDWISPVNTTPDYFNTCAENPQVKLPLLALDGYHKPHSGQGCAGISMFSGRLLDDTADYFCEYIETKLSAPLQAGHSYYVSYYVCLTNHSEETYNIVSVDNIGARLTTQMIDTTCQGPMYYINGPPDISTPPGLFITDSVNWTLVSGIFHASGGEQWLTIGRFYTDVVNYQFLHATPENPDPRVAVNATHSICYMLIDDVCVTDMSNPESIDTNILTPQFPVAIGLGKANGEYLWDNGDTSQQIEVSAPGNYVRQRWSECGYYLDTFSVIQVPVDYCVALPTAFTPNNDGLNDAFGPGDGYCHPDFSDYVFNIYNKWGQLVFQSVNPGEKWDGKTNGIPQEIGVYYYSLRYQYSGVFAAQNPSQGKSALLRGDVTLIR